MSGLYTNKNPEFSITRNTTNSTREGNLSIVFSNGSKQNYSLKQIPDNLEESPSENENYHRYGVCYGFDITKALGSDSWQERV